MPNSDTSPSPQGGGKDKDLANAVHFHVRDFTGMKAAPNKKKKDKKKLTEGTYRRHLCVLLASISLHGIHLLSFFIAQFLLLKLNFFFIYLLKYPKINQIIIQTRRLTPSRSR